MTDHEGLKTFRSWYVRFKYILYKLAVQCFPCRVRVYEASEYHYHPWTSL
jgi:hypothetical protein